jgi:hypothetical protein
MQSTCANAEAGIKFFACRSLEYSHGAANKIGAEGTARWLSVEHYIGMREMEYRKSEGILTILFMAVKIGYFCPTRQKGKISSTQSLLTLEAPDSRTPDRDLYCQ